MQKYMGPQDSALADVACSARICICDAFRYLPGPIGRRFKAISSSENLGQGEDISDALIDVTSELAAVDVNDEQEFALYLQCQLFVLLKLTLHCD